MKYNCGNSTKIPCNAQTMRYQNIMLANSNINKKYTANKKGFLDKILSQTIPRLLSTKLLPCQHLILYHSMFSMQVFTLLTSCPLHHGDFTHPLLHQISLRTIILCQLCISTLKSRYK